MIANLLYKLYHFNNLRWRRIIRMIVLRIEKSEFTSKTLRRIFADYHKVKIGIYTHGGCFIPFQVDKHTTIGNYCSIAGSVRIINRNHPMEFLSTHAIFCNPVLGLCKEDKLTYIPLEIGNDVWIGHGAIIMPHVKAIGDGAVIAAGAVVNKDVPPYAIVVGNPARVVRYRFTPEQITTIQKTKWYEKSLDELKSNIDMFFGPYEGVN